MFGPIWTGNEWMYLPSASMERGVDKQLLNNINHAASPESHYKPFFHKKPTKKEQPFLPPPPPPPKKKKKKKKKKKLKPITVKRCGFKLKKKRQCSKPRKDSFCLHLLLYPLIPVRNSPLRQGVNKSLYK